MRKLIRVLSFKKERKIIFLIDHFLIHYTLYIMQDRTALRKEIADTNFPSFAIKIVTIYIIYKRDYYCLNVLIKVACSH